MNGLETPIMRPIRWMGNSKKNLLKFPPEVKKVIGDELQFIQFGGMPKDAKPFKGLGSGVFELAIKHDKEAYRTVVAVQLGDKIYVLHAFRCLFSRGEILVAKGFFNQNCPTYSHWILNVSSSMMTI